MLKKFKGIGKGSVLNLSTGLSPNPRLFEDDFFLLFSVVHERNTSAYDLNDGFLTINNWDCQCKMSFCPDFSKQTQAVVFSRKMKNQTNNQVIQNLCKNISVYFQMIN